MLVGWRSLGTTVLEKIDHRHHRIEIVTMGYIPVSSTQTSHSRMTPGRRLEKERQRVVDHFTQVILTRKSRLPSQPADSPMFRGRLSPQTSQSWMSPGRRLEKGRRRIIVEPSRNPSSKALSSKS